MCGHSIAGVPPSTDTDDNIMRVARIIAIRAISSVILLAGGTITARVMGRGEDAKAVDVSSPVEEEIARVVAEIDKIEAATIERLKQPPDNQVQQVEMLGKLLLFDKELSVNRNEACAFCHTPETGFTGPISELNRTFAAYPGSVRTRFSNRKPQTHTYAAYSPVLHYNAAQGDLVGGNFWDMRATGRRLGNPAAEQAQGPPVNAVEMGLSDTACMVYRASQRPYRAFFENVWGKQAFEIEWPANVEDICNMPGPPSPEDPSPVHLSTKDRGIASATFDQIAMSIAGFEASGEVSPFSSKFDAMLGGKATLTAQEREGYDLFRGKANCNTCHRDGGPGEEPFFADFTASNIGTPANPLLPYYQEDKPDRFGYVANKDGASYVDLGVGAFLENKNLLSRPSVADANWVKHAAANNGRVQVPTLRNVDKRPNPQFVKAYGHNGYFKSLKEIVHFYNTRDVLPRCEPGNPGEKKTCWPPPETTANMNTKTVGRLGLSEAEEDALVEFMRALTDGYRPPGK
jgi:cytochrome c peroxidase